MTATTHLDEGVVEAATKEAVAEWIACRVGESEPLDERVDVHGDVDGARTVAVQVEIDVDDVVRHPGDGERGDDRHQQTDATSSTADQSPHVLLSRRPLAVAHDVAAMPEDAGDLHVGRRHRYQRHDVQHDEHRDVVRVLPVDVAPLLLARRHEQGARHRLDRGIVDDDNGRRDGDGDEPDDDEDDEDATSGDEQPRLHRPHDGVQPVDADRKQRQHADAHRDALDERRQLAHDNAIYIVAVDVWSQSERHAHDYDQQITHGQVHQEHVGGRAHV